MLDQQNGEAALAVEILQNRYDAVGLGRPQPRHHLVEQQQLRIGGERARHLQPLAVGQGQRRGGNAALVVEIEAAQHFMRAAARVGNVVPAHQRADDDVVLDAERRKRPHDLEGTPDAAPADAIRRQAFDALASEGDGAAVGREYARDHVEQSGLAGAVRTDHSENAAFRHVEAELVDRDEAAEALADAIDFQERAHGSRSVSPSRRLSQGQMPSGSAMITISRQMP